MPLTAVKKGQTSHVGALVDIKYLGKFYEAEILKISGMWFGVCCVRGLTLNKQETVYTPVKPLQKEYTLCDWLLKGCRLFYPLPGLGRCC